MAEKDTQKFTVPSDDRENMRRILRGVYEALTEKGYNPINQIVGYLLTEDPTYITNYNNARSMICKIDRDELMQALVREYLFQQD
ncbi:MAG: IreB family regulatory phosphoprotein [Faecousia sp.]